MNKKEFIDMIADKASLTKKDAEIALQAVTDSLTELLAKGDSIVLRAYLLRSVLRVQDATHLLENLSIFQKAMQ